MTLEGVCYAAKFAMQRRESRSKGAMSLSSLRVFFRRRGDYVLADAGRRFSIH